MQVSRANTVEKGQYFTTLDDTERNKLKGSCREYTLPRSDKSSQMKGWIRGNTKIGSVLDVAVSYHQGRFGVEIVVNSPFGDGTRWRRIVNGINNYVTEMPEESHTEDIGESTGKPVANARPKQTPSSTWSWAEVDVRRTRMIRQKLSGSIGIDDQIAATWWHSTSRKWRSSQIPRLGINISFRMNVFFALVNSNMAKFLAKWTWSHEEIPILSGSQFTWNSTVPLQDNVLLPNEFAEHICHVGSSHDLHSIIQSGLIPDGKKVKKGRHAVFFAAVSPMFAGQQNKVVYDLTKPRIAPYKINWEVHQNTVCWSIRGLLKEKDCTSIKHDPTQSFFTTLYPRCASRRCEHEVNTLCAHGCVVFDGDNVFCLRNTGARAGPTTVWALWTQDNRGPHGRNRSQALRCVHQPPLPVDPTLFWFSRLSLACLLHLMVPSVSWPGSHDPLSCAALCAGAPEASWPRSAFPASRMSEVSHRLMTASRTSVIPGSFPGGDAGPRGPAPLSPRELLK